MIKIFVIAHQPLASAIYSCAGHLFTKEIEHLVVYDVKANQEIKRSYLAAVDLIQQNQNVETDWLIFADTFGSTPGNIAKKLAESYQAPIVYGFNLAMLWSAIQNIDESLDAIQQAVILTTKNSIKLTMPELPTKIAPQKVFKSCDD